MQHERDDHRPELDEAEGESGSLAPDLTAAFFAALDEGESAAPPPPIEQRFEALLDLSSAFDRFDAPRAANDSSASATPHAAATEALSAPSSEAQPERIEPLALLPAHIAELAELAEPEMPDVATVVAVGATAEGIVEPPVSAPALAEPEPAASISSASPPPLLSVNMAEDATSDAPIDLEEFIVFSLADTRCVVPIRNVVEVGRIPDAAPVPHAPAWLHGLGNLRGQVLSLIDLRAFLGLGRIRPSSGRMIVLRADADEVVAGLMVDQVHQIVQLAPSRFQAAPSTLPPGYGGFVWGVCEYGLHTMVGLDVDGVLGAEALHGESALSV